MTAVISCRPFSADQDKGKWMDESVQIHSLSGRAESTTWEPEFDFWFCSHIKLVPNQSRASYFCSNPKKQRSNREESLCFFFFYADKKLQTELHLYCISYTHILWLFPPMCSKMRLAWNKDQCTPEMFFSSAPWHLGYFKSTTFQMLSSLKCTPHSFVVRNGHLKKYLNYQSGDKESTFPFSAKGLHSGTL